MILPHTPETSRVQTGKMLCAVRGHERDTSQCRSRKHPAFILTVQ